MSMKVIHKRWMGKTIKKRKLTSREEIAKWREKVILHYQGFGIKSTVSAFDVGKRSLFRWKKQYTENYCNWKSLIPKSTVRKTRNVRYVNPEISKLIQVERMKQVVGKEKLKRLIDKRCRDTGIATLSVSTVGRILKSMKENKQIPSYDKVTYYATTNKIIKREKQRSQKERRKGFAPSSPGQLCQIDTVELRIHGIKRYTINIIDLYTRLSYSKCYTRLNSKNAQETFKEAQEYFGFSLQRVQSDNGLEFHKDFDAYLKDREITHYWNYPKCPKMNGTIERYNRTIQEELLYRIRPIMKSHLDYVNKILLPQYLHYYNKERLHQSLDYKTPYEYYLEIQSRVPDVVD